jgi:hypothetical protein
MPLGASLLVWILRDDSHFFVRRKIYISRVKICFVTHLLIWSLGSWA